MSLISLAATLFTYDSAFSPITINAISISAIPTNIPTKTFCYRDDDTKHYCGDNENQKIRAEKSGNVFEIDDFFDTDFFPSVRYIRFEKFYKSKHNQGHERRYKYARFPQRKQPQTAGDQSRAKQRIDKRNEEILPKRASCYFSSYQPFCQKVTADKAEYDKHYK